MVEWIRETLRGWGSDMNKAIYLIVAGLLLMILWMMVYTKDWKW